MNSIEFGKKCRPYHIQYRDIFGKVPCYTDYACSQEEYFNALLKAIETKVNYRKLFPNTSSNAMTQISCTK